MMSSAIPARLEFQCGHAALVSLPRIKGETISQRNDRIAHEKTASQARPCDFCTPAVVLQPSHIQAAPLPEPAAAAPPTIPVTQPVATVATGASTSVQPRVVRRPVAAQTRPTPAALPKRERPQPAARIQRESDVRRPTNGAVHGNGRPNGRVSTTTRLRFTVTYVVEKTVVAHDVRDALGQVESLGATEVVAITSAS